jgi:uncharacterized protein (DUF934 family)
MELLKKPLPKQLVKYTDWLQVEPASVEAVSVNSDVDTHQLLSFSEYFQEVQVDFPMFADGRGFSIARLLRRAGFSGTIRAVGDVAVDRVPFMQRVGFDAVELKEGETASLVPDLLNRVNIHYQTSSDGQGPVYL